jgi:preprotein translocase subunit SecY
VTAARVGSGGGGSRITELYWRIAYTFGMLAVYRVGCAIPTPGVDPVRVRAFFEDQGGGVFAIFNMFSGGALEQFSIFALGIMPYISMSIILQLLSVVIPQLEELRKEGEEGRRVITRYTRYGTVGLALLQGLLMATALEAGAFGAGTVAEPGWSFRLMTMITLSAGTAFIMWLGEQITERGIGNGISLIIFSGIVTAVPSAAVRVIELVRTDQLKLFGVIILTAAMLLVIAAIVFFERAQRRIPIQFARRVVGRQVVGGTTTSLPLKLNTSGVIPPIFASSILLLPLQFTNFGNNVVTAWISDNLNATGLSYNLIYVGLIIFFAYFYTSVLFDPNDVADNIRRNGGYVPGIRPGPRTASYIEHVLSRITLIGALYLSAVCVLPVFLSGRFGVPFFFGGTALLIVVGVAMDTVGQVEAHLVSRNYETFMRGKGRIGR